MATETRITEDEITVHIEGISVAHISDCGNGMEAEIFEGNMPLSEGGKQIRLAPSDLIRLAKFLLDKAADRAEDLELA